MSGLDVHPVARAGRSGVDEKPNRRGELPTWPAEALSGSQVHLGFRNFWGVATAQKFRDPR
jgi:hypothetical protein